MLEIPKASNTYIQLYLPVPSNQPPYLGRPRKNPFAALLVACPDSREARYLLDGVPCLRRFSGSKREFRHLPPILPLRTSFPDLNEPLTALLVAFLHPEARINPPPV